MPLHPILVHFPIAFFFLELVLLTVRVWRGKALYARFAAFAFWLGYLFMSASVVTGWMDAGGWTGMSQDVRRHFYAAAIAFLVYTVRAAYLRVVKDRGDVQARIQLLGAMAGSLLVALTAYLGGRLVY